MAAGLLGLEEESAILGAEPSPRRRRKEPLLDPVHVRRLIAAAASLSREHWEVVLIIYKTGIEVEGLRRITWRDVTTDKMMWRRRRRADVVEFKLDDPDLHRAVLSFIRRPRRSADKLSRLVREAQRATGMAELEGVTALSLRLTRALEMLRGGMTVEAVAARLALKPAIVRRVARFVKSETSEMPSVTGRQGEATAEE